MTNEQIKAVANTFARDWYNRPGSGCDEATLASQLEYRLTQVVQDIIRAERERTTHKIRKFLEAP